MCVSVVILNLQVSVFQIAIFLFGAIALGVAIHFFVTHRKSIPSSVSEPPVLAESSIHDADEWRIKYYEERETQERLLEEMGREVEEAKGNEEIMTIEVEELRKEIKRLKAETPKQIIVSEASSTGEPLVYLEQLALVQESLMVHNQSLGRLQEQVARLKDIEQNHQDLLKANEGLNEEVQALRKVLADKQGEIQEAQQHQLLAEEMKERLRRAYEEFGILQEHLKTIEGSFAQPQNRRFEFDELQQNFYKLTKDSDDLKSKQLSILEENQRMSGLLADTEDKLREANFQRQQLQKKVGFLEELNQSLQQVSEHNKKLENQLKRIGEIEVMLARVSGKKED